MKTTSVAHAFFTVACAAFFALRLCAADSPREHLSLDRNWKFHLGDDWPRALNLAKAGDSYGPALDQFDDDSWRTLDLPHDWAIELPFDPNADRSHGFKPVGPGFLTNSVGWYRRRFLLPPEDQGKRIWLTFDGVFRDATVWVNGWLVKRHESGYYPFHEDITDALRFGGTNVISVRVDASKFEGWFYEGAGIYRHVWLDKTAPLAIAPDGIFVYAHFKNNVPAGKAEVHVEVTLLNTLTNSAAAVVNCEIVSPDGKSLAKFKDGEKVEGASPRTLRLESKVSSPRLWSPESPTLYSLATTVSMAGKLVDQNETAFGIRTLAFDKDKGFILNGQHYELYGTCNHQDHAGVGAALPDALQYFRISKLKEFGCNAYRTSHNPPTPELLDACDHLGMIVMDESRLLGGDSENLRKWELQIRRDRNHPSVCIWSVANEEMATEFTPQGAAAASSMQNLVRRLDRTRPVTYAAPLGDIFDGINTVIEVRGWNYNAGTNMDNYHAKHPEQANVGTEQASTVCTRGIYADDAERGYVRAYDHRGVQTAETWWSYFAGRPWLSGGFVWTGFDYRGEPTPYSWPCISSHFGVLDTCGFPKDNFWYYQSWWTTNVVLHLLPHWNWPGKEGQEIRVEAVSNCKAVELFLNGASLGKQTMKPNSRLKWPVKYAPGTLSAKGFDAGGKLIAETKVETTGDAMQIQLIPDRRRINADGEDISVITVAALDAQGRVVPVAMNKIHFSLGGPGKIIGAGNGDPSCHEPDTFVPQMAVQYIPLNDWRWKRLSFSTKKGGFSPEFAPEFDDSSWEKMDSKNNFALKDGEQAVYRTHVKLTEAELDNPGALVQFRMIDDHGWIYVNNQFVAASLDWQTHPTHDIRKDLHTGDNVIAVAVRNEAGRGGLDQDINLELVGKPRPQPWSRSLFNGLAQIIVQSTQGSGEIKLTAAADGLQSATATVQTQPCVLRPSVP